MKASKNGMQTQQKCHDCSRYLMQSYHFVTSPPILALEWSTSILRIDPELTIELQDRSRVRYLLRGVVYFGSGHFVGVTVSKTGNLWFYDGMRDMGKLKYLGTLDQNTPDLRQQGGKSAAAALYVRSSIL